ncbi:hypothetical protein IKE67_04280 [bacterium]|nr:hypothetical protein [bacterium]
MKLKNTIFATTFCLILAAGCSYADGNAFTPLNFDDTAYSVPAASSSKTAITSTPQGVAETNSANSATGNLDLQSAIAKIDTALDDIRNEQNTCKAKFAEIDNQYKFVKNERNNMKKQIRANEKRIRALTKAKNNVGKNVL